MRVVSQSRNYSFDIERTVFWTQYEIIYAKVGTESVAIGKYASSERAADIFQDMHNAYSPYGLICDNLSEEQIQAFTGSKNIRMPVIKMDGISDCTITTYDSVVYYMPEV